MFSFAKTLFPIWKSEYFLYLTFIDFVTFADWLELSIDLVDAALFVQLLNWIFSFRVKVLEWHLCVCWIMWPQTEAAWCVEGQTEQLTLTLTLFTSLRPYGIFRLSNWRLLKIVSATGANIDCTLPVQSSSWAILAKTNRLKATTTHPKYEHAMHSTRRTTVWILCRPLASLAGETMMVTGHFSLSLDSSIVLFFLFAIL